MSDHILRLTVLFLVGTVSLADAGVHERDWRHDGDGLLTVDNVNMREWLDLTETQVKSLPDVVAQLEPGDAYAGFTIGSVDEVVQLLTSAGVDITSKSEENVAPTMSLVRLLGETGDGSFGFIDSSGLASTGIPDEFVTTGVRWSTITDPDRGGWIEPDALDLPRYRGVWLFRPVPEPTGWLLWVTALSFLPRFLQRNTRSLQRTRIGPVHPGRKTPCDTARQY